jgi:ribose/xylose/arabinose/galactoside ABC-type transport system permease subunit
LLRTPQGNWVFASGGDRNAAANSGVPVRKVKISLFMVTAICAALVAIITVMDAGSTDARRGFMKEFEAIIAAVIGGCLLTGGYGSAIGAFFGAIIFGMVTIGLTYTDFDQDWFQIFLGGMLLIAVLVGIGYHVLLNRTRFGFDLRASGINPFAARAGGVPPKRMVVAAMMLSGAVAGLIGIVELADRGKFPPDPIQGLGFAGIAVALLGRNHPGGMVFSALLFAFLDVSSGVLDTTGVASREIATIMQGIVLLTAVVAYGVASRVKERDEARTAAEALAAGASTSTETVGASA